MPIKGDDSGHPVKRRPVWANDARWLIGGIGTLVLVLVAAWVLFVPTADWLALHDIGGAATPALRQTARDAARGRLLTLGAGLFAAGALVFTGLNFNLLRRNSEQADQWQRRTYELTEQSQVTDRYTKAIAQLGDDKLDIRIGGVYALERIARDSARDHPTIMEVLTAFIREHSHESWASPSGISGKRPDIQAALTVIGRRETCYDVTYPLPVMALRGRPRLNLTGADLSEANLWGASLGGAILAGANLTGAFLYAAYLGRANLTGANLARANLTGANLWGADLIGADLSEADLSEADLSEADLSEADLLGATWPDDALIPTGWQRDETGRMGINYGDTV